MTVISNDPSQWPVIDSSRIIGYFVVVSATAVIYDWMLVMDGSSNLAITVHVIVECNNQGIQMLLSITRSGNVPIAVRTLQRLQALEDILVETVPSFCPSQPPTRE
ncbi:hypothetical protein AZE42_09969 [Rhizopogon vesiculosus]|uniref:Uncharacterized protein n=1 Tax=Rhizopogon vesiculosus TaxID=180088 RepID=A0A1J8PM49_9AGAM|nr:hypothetical protein AZE42_09969 [Rhizopogon vesiculosus]